MTAVTVTVVAALEAWESVAVTVVDPPFSGIEEDATDNATVGAASSSAIVNVTLDGFDTPPPDAVAETVTDLSGSSVVSATAVTVTAPVLVVEPAATVSVFALESVKPLPVADTVSVTAALDARFKRAVTVETPPDSGTDEDESANVATGVASSSVNVRLGPVTAPTPWALIALPVTVTVRSSTLSMASFTAVIVALSIAFEVLPAAIMTVVSEPTV